MTTSTLRQAALLAPDHPALRWTPQWAPDVRGQHRRNHDGSGTRCGLVGTLVLAESDDPRCERGCWG